MVIRQMDNESDAGRLAFWDSAYASRGHTGYADRLRHRYDQPLRLATIGRVIDRLWPNGLRARKALDIGSGAGDFVALLRARGANVTACDISPEVVSAGARRFDRDEEVRWLVGAVSEIELPPATFDVITSITVLQHVVDDEEFVKSLSALRTALRPDGRMILLELAPLQAMPVNITDQTGYVYLRERPPAHWEQAFTMAGLRIVEKPVFPQLGIALLRGLSWLITRIVSPRAGAPQASPPEAQSGAGSHRPVRRLKRGALELLRRAVLLISRPFDHVLRVALPPARFRQYRCYVVAPASSP